MTGTEAVNSIKYQGAPIAAQPTAESENIGFTGAVRNGVGGLFHGLGSIFHAASRGCDAICNAAPPTYFAYIDATRMAYNGWGFYSAPVFYYPPVVYTETIATTPYTTVVTPQYTVSTMPQYTVAPYTIQGVPQSLYNYTPAVDNGPFFNINAGPSSLNALSFGAPNYSISSGSSIKDTANFIDRMFHPENFNIDGTRKDSSSKPEDKPVTIVDKQTGKNITPDWYKAIVSDMEDKKEVSDGKKQLRKAYENIQRKYNIYKLDSKTLDIKCDAQGEPVKAPFYSELKQLNNLLEAGKDSVAQAYLNKCDEDKLAAIEIHYEKEFGKSLRRALKDCGQIWGLGYLTEYNPDWAKAQWDRLDKSAMKTPENMVAAFKQITEEQNLFGLGFDKDRAIKLLKMMLHADGDTPEQTSYKKAFVEAFKSEFDMGTLNKKWCKGEEVENLINKLIEFE